MKRRFLYLIFASLLTLALLFGAGIGSHLSTEMFVSAAEEVPTVQTALDVATVAQPEAVTMPAQETLVNLYETASPSVVNIDVTMQMQSAQAQQPMPFPFGQQPETPRQARSEGTGWVWDTAGHIVTNNHVVENATEIVVNFSDGHWAEAELVARDPQADLAVIKVDAPEGVDLRPLPLAQTDVLKVGHYVIAIGSPFGLDETMTMGVISAMGRSMPVEAGSTGATYSLPDVIQTDTAINPGNSGGPLLNLNGEVVGVNFAINSPVRANSGVGFAIPVSVVEKVVPALIEEGAYRYPYLGISGTTIDAYVAEARDLSEGTLGVYVAAVPEGGPAAQAGLQVDDIIVGMDDQAVVRFEDVLSYLFTRTQPGQVVTMHILRNGQPMTVDVTVGERPDADQPQATQEQETPVSTSEAIGIARDAVAETGMMDNVESVSAKQAVQDGRPVWVISLSDAGTNATVIVDAHTGDVLELNFE